MRQTIIGLTGYARSGKDTAAVALIERHGFVRFGFADLLKKVAYDVAPYVETTPGRFERLPDVVDRLGWEKAKSFDDVRGLLQRLGTEGGRNNLGTNVWVEPVIRAAAASTSPVVITDVRFSNEVDAVKGAGGLVVRVDRPGVSAVNAHASDAGIAGLSVDLTLANDGTTDELHDKVSSLYRRIGTNQALLQSA